MGADVVGARDRFNSSQSKLLSGKCGTEFEAFVPTGAAYSPPLMQLQLSAAFNGCSLTGFADKERLPWRPGMGLEGRSVLFISYNGMLDALGQTQVIPYLRELAKRGRQLHITQF